MATLRLAAAIAATLVLAACGGPSISTGRPKSADVAACPDVSVLELLHDAVFFLEHRRDLERVAHDLDEIGRAVAARSPGETMVLDLTNRIAALAAREGPLEPEAESIRAELHAWPCLTKDAHERFHRALPLPR